MADRAAASGPNGSEPLLRVENLVKHFPISTGTIIRKRIALKAVDGVSFEIRPGETLGLVGESGCGKSTVARTLLRLVEPTSGRALFQGQDIFAMGRHELRRLRRRVQIIFQDPYASLDPRMTVGEIVSEPWVVHGMGVSAADRLQRAQDMLVRVGLSASDATRFPYEFSGGQRQRIGIARALITNPELVVCDEPISALDVSVQAQIVNLLEDLQDEFGIAYLFIAHDLSVVRHISDRIAVMYLGRIVEIGDEASICDRPTHPYTQALLSAVPVPDPAAARRDERIVLEGEVPNPIYPPSGCRFRTRCWKAEQLCADEVPELIDRHGHGHPSACHFAEQRQVLPIAT
ncbi:MAG: ATP-binding cassette domain-containing protein [Proteobacteria bacterium]|nr:ATP-binding cassette domain-containing protein [Pseudomonadota bacterium]